VAKNSRKPRSDRATIIQTVQTPLGFFVLVVLVVEVIFGLIASLSASQRTYLIVAMTSMMFLLVGVVAFFAYYRPEALAGIRPAAAAELAAASKLETVPEPRVLCAATPVFENLGFEGDIGAIRAGLGREPEVLHEASSAGLRKTLTARQYDIIHLLGNVDPLSGDLVCGEGVDRLPAEAVETLLKVCKARLVVLMCCDSIALAARLSRTVSVIAGLGVIEDRSANDWAECFYRMLANGKSLSAAYEIARATTTCSMVLLLRDNLLFSKET